MELSKLRCTIFCMFCVLTSLSLAFIIFWNDFEWNKYQMVAKQFMSFNKTIPGQNSNNSKMTEIYTMDSPLYYAPGEELRQKSDDLKDLTPEEFYAKLNKSLQDAQKQKFTIIYLRHNSIGSKRVASMPYHCGNCDVVYALDKVNESSTKAVVFHLQSAREKFFPKLRRPDQLYVWQSRESTARAQRFAPFEINDSHYLNFFNMTMTPRRFGDVWDPYTTEAELYLRKGLPKNDRELDSIIANKTELALWVVSNCGGKLKHMNGSTRRMKYAKEMITEGLDIQLGGKCFKDTKKDFKNRKYKFYLAFENSNCHDYITEKFWRNSLLYDVVPVVLGAPKSDYIATAPPNSFIYAPDFESPKKLVEYLKYLDKNVTAYKEYFQWMKLEFKDMKFRHRTHSFCQLCRILHGINIDNLYNTRYTEEYKVIPMFGFPTFPRIISSLKDYLFNNEENGCLDFPI